MLKHEQLEKILEKDKLSFVDLDLLENHIEYISNIQEEYEDGLPEDVFENLQNDLVRIIDKLESYRKKLKTKRLKKLV